MADGVRLSQVYTMMKAMDPKITLFLHPTVAADVSDIQGAQFRMVRPQCLHVLAEVFIIDAEHNNLDEGGVDTTDNHFFEQFGFCQQPVGGAIAGQLHAVICMVSNSWRANVGIWTTGQDWERIGIWINAAAMNKVREHADAILDLFSSYAAVRSLGSFGEAIHIIRDRRTIGVR